MIFLWSKSKTCKIFALILGDKILMQILFISSSKELHYSSHQEGFAESNFVNLLRSAHVDKRSFFPTGTQSDSSVCKKNICLLFHFWIPQFHNLKWLYQVWNDYIRFPQTYQTWQMNPFIKIIFCCYNKNHIKFTTLTILTVWFSTDKYGYIFAEWTSTIFWSC